MEPVHAIERSVAAEQVDDVEIADVESPPEQCEIHLAMVVGETGAPNPRPPRRGLFGLGDKPGVPIEADRGARKALPLGGRAGKAEPGDDQAQPKDGWGTSK
jgi:hypothetical protein